MGQAIVYCSGCQVQLRDPDFEKGSAHRIEGQSYCARCARAAVKALPAEKIQAAVNRLPPTEETPSRRGHHTTRILHVLSQPKGTARFTGSKAPSTGLVAGLAAGGVALLVVLGLAAAGGRRPPATPPQARTPEPVVPYAPPAPPAERPAPGPRPAAGALRKAREFRQIHPANFSGQIALYERAVEESRGTPSFEEARGELETIRQAERARVAADFPAVERAAAAACRDEKFQQALKLLDDARERISSGEWKTAIERKYQDVAGEAERLHERLRAEAVEARKKGAEPPVQAIRERVAGWGIERFRVDLDQALAAAKPPPPTKEPPKPPSETKLFRPKWEAALALAAVHDFPAAIAELERAAPSIQDPAIRTEAARDLELLRLAGAAHQEARQALVRAAKGQTLRLAFFDPSGHLQQAEGTVSHADSFRVELRKDDRGTRVDLGEVRGASFAEHFLARHPKRSESELAAAALLCLLEADAEAAARILPETSPELPKKYWDRARRPAAPGAEAAQKEAEARRLFQAAEREFAGHATAADAVLKYAQLLKDFAGCPFVRRNAGFIAARAEGGREFFFVFEDLAGGGGFRPSKAGDDAFWISATDAEESRAAENYVELAFSALPSLDYRCWVWVGGCCEEVLTFGCQGTDMTGPDPRTKEVLRAEPGSPAWLPVKQVLSTSIRSHAAHAGRRPTPRWGWVQIPLPKYAAGGIKKVRVVTPRPGLQVQQAIVSASRQAPPLNTEARDLERARHEARGGVASRGPAVDPSLVGHWKLDEGKGETAADSSSSGIPGALRNGASWSPGTPPTVLLGGKNDYVNLGANLPILRNVPGCTMAAWVRADKLATTAEEQNIILAISKNSGDTPGIESRASLLLTDSGNVEAGGRSADSDKYQKARTANRPIALGRWIHIAAVVDYAGDRVSIYVNGVLAASAQVDFSLPATANTPSTCAAIGSDDNGTRRYFDGRLSDVRVYNRALSAAEVSTLFAAQPAPR